MITIRRSGDRGHADHGWLDTHHTFSFAHYQDPEHMGFSKLRVVNQDRVQPARGFGTHGHRNTEIISCVLDGVLEHRDSMGTGSRIHPGDVQFMSAGSGVAHSEFNGSQDDVTEVPADVDRPRAPGHAAGLPLVGVASPCGRLVGAMNPEALARWMPAVSVLAVLLLDLVQHLRLKKILGYSPAVTFRNGPPGELVRVGLAAAGCLLLVLTSVFPGILELLPRLDPAPAGVAFGLMIHLGAILLAVIALVGLGDAWRIGIDDRSEARLVTTGAYSFVRHPIYTAIILWLLGLAMMSLSLVHLLIAITGIVLVVLQARREEDFLMSVFGGRYAMYQKTVGQLVPRPVELGLRDWWRRRTGRDG